MNIANFQFLNNSKRKFTLIFSFVFFVTISAQNTKSSDPIPYPSLRNSTNQNISNYSKPSVVIRDGNSLNQVNPLIIINDVELDYKQLNSIDPNKILSIDVLKDKNAIDLFGEKGKNGVLIIKAEKDYLRKYNPEIL